MRPWKKQRRISCSMPCWMSRDLRLVSSPKERGHCPGEGRQLSSTLCGTVALVLLLRVQGEDEREGSRSKDRQKGHPFQRRRRTGGRGESLTTRNILGRG